MSRRIVVYDFSEDDKKLIVSRLLGEHYSQCTSDEQGRYCGYIDDAICEVKFFSFMVSVFIREKGKKRIPRKEWVNVLYRKLFQDNTLDFEKSDKKDFNRYAYAEVDYDNLAVDFLFQIQTNGGCSMKKQEFRFIFPMSGDETTKKLNPLAIKETAIRYLKGQSEIRGDVCIIKNTHKEVVAMAYLNDDMSVSFFTEDESVNDIVNISEQEGGNDNE